MNLRTLNSLPFDAALSRPLGLTVAQEDRQEAEDLASALSWARRAVPLPMSADERREADYDPARLAEDTRAMIGAAARALARKVPHAVIRDRISSFCPQPYTPGMNWPESVPGHNRAVLTRALDNLGLPEGASAVTSVAYSVTDCS